MGRVKSKKNDNFLEKEIIKKLGEPKFNYSFLCPVKNGYIKYTDLINGGLTLFDIEVMNNGIVYLDKAEEIVINFNKPKKDGRKVR
jgi:ribosome biogenesis SPOUT family RNA methylase Rps3